PRPEKSSNKLATYPFSIQLLPPTPKKSFAKTAKIGFSPLILLETSCDVSRADCRAPGTPAEKIGAAGPPPAARHILPGKIDNQAPLVSHQQPVLFAFH